MMRHGHANQVMTFLILPAISLFEINNNAFAPLHYFNIVYQVKAILRE